VNKEASDRVRVFVSYARKNADFVDRLDQELRSRSIQTLIDREQIALSEAWWARVTDLIGQAHCILFVLSPEWLGSEVCKKELDVALSMNKRLVPVLCRQVKSTLVPPALGQLNWLPLLDEDSLAAATDQIVTAFQTDIAWLREHTRLSEQARYWDRDGRPEGALLRDEALFAAERWIAQRPPNAPAPTDLFSEYLRAGREVYEREERARRDLLERTMISQSRMLAERAGQLLDEGDAISAILLCLEALPDDSQKVIRPFVRPAEVICYKALCNRRELRIFHLPKSKVTDVALSDDGTRVLAMTSRGACVLDAQTAAQLAFFTCDTIIFRADGRQATTIDKESIRTWNLASEKGPQLLHKFGVANAPRPAQYLPASGRGWVGRGGSLQVCEFVHGRQPPPLRKQPRLHLNHDFLRFSVDGQRIVTTPFYGFSNPTTVRTWDARTRKMIAELNGHGGYVATAEFGPDGSSVVTGSADETARVWDASTGRTIVTLRGHQDWVACARLSDDASMLITGSYDNSFRIWSIPSGKPLALLRGHSGDVPKTTNIGKGFWPTARFSADGKQVVTAWKDHTVRLWNVEPASDLKDVLTGHKARINSVVFHPDGSCFASASDDGRIIVWDARTRSQMASWREADKVSGIAFSSDGRQLAAGVGSNIVVRDLRTRETSVLISVGRNIGSIAFSPLGNSVAVTSVRGATVWDIATSKLLSSFNQGDSGYCVQLAPSGLVAVSCGDERAIRLWNPSTGRQICRAIFHGTSVNSVAFDPRGRRIVTGCYDHTSRIWTVGTEPSEENIVVLSGHDGTVASAVFSPSGEQVVTASADRTVRVWNSTTGECLAVFEGHSDAVTKAVFSPSNSQIVSVSWDKTIRVQQIFPTTQSLVDYAKKVVPRALTREQRDAFFLDPEPPAWHIEQEKWPYR
jgi:WD40 repeat protein